MIFEDSRQYAKRKGISHKDVIGLCQGRRLKSVSIYYDAAKLIIQDGGSDCYVIALSTMKGGVAKTTTAVHLAVLLAKKGFRTLLIDSDHQNQCKEFFEESAYDEHYNLAYILQGGEPEECIREISESGLHTIFSSFDIAVIGRNYDNSHWLEELVEPLKPKYDFIIVDTSPAYDMITEGVLRGATHVIMPMNPERLSVTGYNHNLRIFQQIPISEEKIAGILITKVNPRVRLHQLYTEEIQSILGNLAFESQIPESAFFVSAVENHQDLFSYRENSAPSQALKKFIWELLQRL